MKKLKVLTVVGTRPEIIRLSRIINRLEEYCDHHLVHTGQNYDYELNQIFFDELGLRQPDYFLNSAKSSNSPSNTIGNLIISTDAIFEKLCPDALLVLGDTNSCLSVIPAKRHKIPIFHMEAGNRCFDQRVPEEINRRIVDHTSDVNLTYSTIARNYLLREGLPPDLKNKIGSPMFEVLNYYNSNINLSSILSKLKLKHENYFLVSAHREENIESPENFSKLINVLNGLADSYKLPIIVSTHPRTQKKITTKKIKFNSLVQLVKPLGFFDFMKLQICARATLSDSGTISEEASIMNFPALNLRDSHERPEAMEEAAVMMVGLDLDRIKNGLQILSNQPRGHDRNLPSSILQASDYNQPNVSDKVVRILYSYTDYINRVIWKKY